MQQEIIHIPNYGRHNIDKWVIDFYIKHPQFNKNSFFVELGADDGIKFSNTLAFEKHFNWDGICIEPNPEAFLRLQKNRKCHTEQALVYSKKKEILRFFVHRRPDKSGIPTHMREQNIHKRPTISLTTTTLQDVLQKYHSPKFIEFLSLDTEGSEYEILKNFPFDIYTFGIMLIERNKDHDKIEDLLTIKQYIKIERHKRSDDYYVHQKLI